MPSALGQGQGPRDAVKKIALRLSYCNLKNVRHLPSPPTLDIVSEVLRRIIDHPQSLGCHRHFLLQRPPPLLPATYTAPHLRQPATSAQSTLDLDRRPAPYDAMSFSSLVSDITYRDRDIDDRRSHMSRARSFASTAATSVSISGDISSQLHGGYSHPLARAWQAERQLTKVRIKLGV